MNHIFLVMMVLASIFSGCDKKDSQNNETGYGNGPSTNVSSQLQGTWMYGNFSMTEYWSQNPSEYLGNAFQFAIAFKFNSNGTYEQYFTSSTVSGAIVTYQQSVTKGTVEINEAAKTIITHANSTHYKRTKSGQVIEERDLNKNELTLTSNYSYELKTESNGTKAIYLKLNNAGDALQFLKKN